MPFQCTALIKLLRRPQQKQQGMLDTTQIRPRTCAMWHTYPLPQDTHTGMSTLVREWRAQYKHFNNSFSHSRAGDILQQQQQKQNKQKYLDKVKAQIKIAEQLPFSLPFPGDDLHAHFNIMYAFQRKLLLRSHSLRLSEDYIFTLYLYHYRAAGLVLLM